MRTQVAYPANVRYEMKSLKPDTLYRVELRAHNVIGFSAPAEILLRTAKGQWHVPSNYSPPRLDFSFVPFAFSLVISLSERLLIN